MMALEQELFPVAGLLALVLLADGTILVLIQKRKARSFGYFAASFAGGALLAMIGFLSLFWGSTAATEELYSGAWTFYRQSVLVSGLAAFFAAFLLAALLALTGRSLLHPAA
jgi:hypothetical protein